MGHYACDMRPMEVSYAMELTDWFPGSCRPVHVGWYDRDYEELDHMPAAIYRDYWDGNLWRYTVHGAIMQNQSRNWRGVTLNSSYGEDLELRALVNDILDGALS